METVTRENKKIFPIKVRIENGTRKYKHFCAIQSETRECVGNTLAKIYTGCPNLISPGKYFEKYEWYRKMLETEDVRIEGGIIVLVFVWPCDDTEKSCEGHI